MIKKFFPLVLVTCLVLTGCGYKKPEVHSMMGLNISSITTICGTDCTMKDIDIKSNGNRVTTTYEYTDVAEEKGLADAKKYYDYLSHLPSCANIDDYEEAKGFFQAKFKVTDKIDEGFLMKVSFTKDTYTVQIEDNAKLDDKQ